MPIRHCQKCGLKVLIDESQTAGNPFYCQRCTASMKSDASMGAVATPPRRLTPASTPSPAAVAAAAATTVKVFCPYCKASFNGRIPAKPARGQCPLCQKDLILLPTGEIRPAAGFDPAAWQKSGAAPPPPPPVEEEAPKETGTRMLVRQFAADPGATAAKAEAGARIIEETAAPAPPPEETQVNDDGSVPLPDWLDDEPKPAPKAPPEPMPVPVEVKSSSETAEAEPVKLEDLPPPPPPPPARKAPAKAAPPPPAAPKAAPARKSAASGVQKKVTERRAAPAPVLAEIESTPGPTGTGKFMLALALVVLPLIACPVLLAVRPNLAGSVVEKVGVLFGKGFQALDAKVFPTAEAAPAPVEEKKPAAAPPPETPAQPSAEDKAQWERDITKLIEQTRRRERDLRQSSVAATPEQKAALAQVREQQDRDLEKLKNLQALYRKFYGADYDPEK